MEQLSHEIVQVVDNRNPPHFKGPKLTKLNRLFVNAYTDLGNLDTFQHGYNSAVKAGYSEKSAYEIASRLLASDKIKQEIARIEAHVNEQTNFSRQDYVKILVNNAGQCKAEAVKARYWEMIGRAKGFIEPEDNKSASISLFQQLDSKIGQRLQVLEGKQVIDIKQLDINVDDNANNISTSPSLLPV